MKTKILMFIATFLICSIIPQSKAHSRQVAIAKTITKHRGNHKSGWLGVSIQDVTKRLTKNESLSVTDGAYVTDVVNDSPAEKSGIKEGDVITKFDGIQIGRAHV